jgi:Ni/Co efflux regulator RcnB
MQFENLAGWLREGGLMKRLKMYLIAAALMTGGSALASAQPIDHGRGDRFQDRDRDNRDRDKRDRDDRRFRDRDDRRSFDRDDHRYVVDERRFFNGYYWNWDGARWCRRDGRAVFYFNF